MYCHHMLTTRLNITRHEHFFLLLACQTIHQGNSFQWLTSALMIASGNYEHLEKTHPGIPTQVCPPRYGYGGMVVHKAHGQTIPKHPSIISKMKYFNFHSQCASNENAACQTENKYINLRTCSYSRKSNRNSDVKIVFLQRSTQILNPQKRSTICNLIGTSVNEE